MNIFISAGEASGEQYGALLMEAVRAGLGSQSAHFFGLGGPRMQALGFEATVKAEDVAVMGITEVIRHMPHIYGEYRQLVRRIEHPPPGRQRPDVAVLIDFPDVNLRLAAHLRRLGVPVLYFVSPQLWAWKKRRIQWVRERVSRMLVIFPFEQRFYRDRGVDAEFVGHPLAGLALPHVSRQHFADRWNLNASNEWIGLLPGSRRKELRLNLPGMVQSAQLLGPGYEYLLPVAATLDPAQVRQAVAEQVEKLGKVNIHVVSDARAVLHHAQAAMVASGTATVEAALIGNPFIVVYRVSPVTYAVASRLVKMPEEIVPGALELERQSVAMVNLIAGRRVVPELIQSDFTPARAVEALRPLLEPGPAREAMQKELAAVRDKLQSPAHKPAIDRVAEETIRMGSLQHPIRKN